MIFISFQVNGEARFSRELLQLTAGDFHGPEFRCEPWHRVVVAGSFSSDGSSGVKAVG